MTPLQFVHAVREIVANRIQPYERALICSVPLFFESMERWNLASTVHNWKGEPSHISFNINPSHEGLRSKEGLAFAFIHELGHILRPKLIPNWLPIPLEEFVRITHNEDWCEAVRRLGVDHHEGAGIPGVNLPGTFADRFDPELLQVIRALPDIDWP